MENTSNSDAKLFAIITLPLLIAILGVSIGVFLTLPKFIEQYGEKHRAEEEKIAMKVAMDHQNFEQDQEKDRRTYEEQNRKAEHAYELQKEYDQVGGKENYEAILKYRSDETSKQVELIKQSKIGDASDGINNSEASMNFTKEEIAAMIKNQVVHGSANADILMIEYTDPECPYCQKQYQYGSIDQALKMEGVGTIAHILKPITGVNHTNTVQKSLALICAGKINGYEGLVSLEKEFFTDMKTSISIAIISAKLDKYAMQTCIADASTKVQFDKNDSEFAKVTANTQGAGTPTTLIINTKTGKSDFIMGSLPVSTFQEKIKALAK